MRTDNRTEAQKPLGDGGIFGLMMTEYNRASEPLRERQKRQEERETRRQEIARSIEVNGAKLGVLSRRTEELIAADDFANADDLKREKTALAGHIEDLKAESNILLSEILKESEGIKNEHQRLAARVLKETFPEVRQQTIAKVRETILFIEATWQALINYEKATAPCLSISLHRERLTPSDILTDAEERALTDAVEYWLGRGIGRPLTKF